ncbi:ACP S-malonyltransferase [bacterium]|nr:ACP S-malonyltransferase [bacterium]
MKKIAFIFPGQGSQAVGMGKDLYDNFEVSKQIFDKANEVLGKDIKNICFEGDEETLKQTVNTQPAILTTSIAALEALKSLVDIKPSFVAGHSLGEYAAYYAAEVLDLEHALILIQKRADLMSDSPSGAMSAVLNATDEQIKTALKRAYEAGYVDVANYNSPSQVVLTGEVDAVNRAGEVLTLMGIKRVIPLAVSGAFHSKLMQSASEKFEEFLENIDINDAKIPVITNVDAEITTENFKPKMSKQICSSVYWTQTIQKMIENGVEIFVELGNGRVLSGLNKKISSDIISYNVYDKATCLDVAEKLKEVL